MNLSAHPYAFAAVGLGLCYWLRRAIKAHKSNPRRLPYPPGPRGYPIVGSLLDVPLKQAWLVYDEWFKIYGDMIYFEVLGSPFLLLGSPEHTKDLLEKRSTNYSDRPRFVMLVEMMEWNHSLAVMPYGPRWRTNRRAFHQYYNLTQVHKYNDIQTREARAFLGRLLEKPDDFMQHIRHLFAAIIMKVTYGISVKESGDPYVYNAEQALKGLTEATVPGRFFVDLIPSMKYIPAWFPGAGWKRWAERYKHISKLVTRKPFEYVKSRMERGNAVPCVATRLIENLPEESAPDRAEREEIARNTAAMAYIAGADTTVSTVQSFFLTMCLYPEVQKKAQEELDTVLGGRLPEFSDRPSLPYINAMIKESLRWQPVLPLIPHMSTNDDEYDGYFIPKGTIVLGSAWTMLHDSAVFDEPLRYMPERYLKDGKLNPDIRDSSMAFGFGRRVCAGRYMSDNSLFITFASVLTCFDIKPGKDEYGRPVNLEPKFAAGALSFPLPFAASITPRSQRVVGVIRGLGISGALEPQDIHGK